MRISNWSSDVCSSDLVPPGVPAFLPGGRPVGSRCGAVVADGVPRRAHGAYRLRSRRLARPRDDLRLRLRRGRRLSADGHSQLDRAAAAAGSASGGRSEEHTSELQSLMRISYAVFCLKKKKTITTRHNQI